MNGNVFVFEFSEEMDCLFGGFCLFNRELDLWCFFDFEIVCVKLVMLI